MINAVRSKNAHKANLISAVTAVFTILSVTFPNTALAHLKEPLGTEIAATPLPGRTLTHSEYNYGEGKHEGEHTCCHGLALEFELGVTHRTQICLEAETVLKEKKGDAVARGAEEVAFGLKHRFFDETNTVEEVKGSLLLTKHLAPRFLTHLELGYVLEKEVEEEEDGAKITEKSRFFIYNLAPMVEVIHERLMALLELNGESSFDNDTHRISLAPEVIFEVKDTFLKLSVPIGLTDETDDIAIRFAISHLF
jgi:hypothetical protein